MPCCKCETCACPSECFPKDHESLDKWRKDFDCLRKQWSDYLVCGTSIKPGICQCRCKKTSNHDLVKGRFGLAWVSETPQKKTCTPCGWQLEICDTPSQVEYQCQKMEQWASCPPIDNRSCSIKPAQQCCAKNKCSSGQPLCHRAPCCAVKVMPFQEASPPKDCSCCKCKSGTNDKAVATDDCNCSEKKNTEQTDKDQTTTTTTTATATGDQNVNDILKPNNGNAGENPPAAAAVTPAAAAAPENTPRNPARGRRGRSRR